MKLIRGIIILSGVAYAGKRIYSKFVAPNRHIGYDTPTGTDPHAKYSQPGYEDESFGQAVNQDQELVDKLLSEHQGDEASAERSFREESAGAPALERQNP